MKKTIGKIIRQHAYSYAEYDNDLCEDFYTCACGAYLGEYEASKRGFSCKEDWHANHLTKKVAKVVKNAKAKAWNKGLSAGRDRWQDNREFGVSPVNPYGETL